MEMDYQTKSNIIAGNIQAMDELVAEIKKRIKTAEADMQTIEDPQHRIYAVFGSLSGMQDLISALQTLSKACYCIDGRIHNID